MTGPAEETNSPYAVAKISWVEMCWAYKRQYGCRFIRVMPTNLYGDNDSFDLENSHDLPALIRKCHLAKIAAAGDLAAINRDEQCFGPTLADIRGGYRPQCALNKSELRRGQSKGSSLGHRQA